MDAGALIPGRTGGGRDHSGEVPNTPSLKAKASWFADLPGRNVVGRHIRENALERLRVWEVRRYCQVKPALFSYNATTGAADAGPDEEGDYALTAILRCVLQELRADLAYISLLDDQTQYFIAGASRAADLDAARAPNTSMQWYGCDSVLHAGGLCNRTIRLEGEKPMYEELDMRAQDYTRSLPFVNGETASLRWYAGVPLVTSKGHVIGTLFIMAKEPAQASMSSPQHDFLCDSAAQVMKQLDQAVQAIEGKRLAAVNAAVNSLARPVQIQGPWNTPDSRSLDARATASEEGVQRHRFYGHAAELLLKGFELSATYLQEVPLNHAPTKQGATSNDENVHFLGVARTSEACEPRALPGALAKQLCELWPDGEIFSRFADSNGSFMTSSHLPGLDQHPQRLHIGKYLAQTYPGAEQILIMPMWDPLHDRVTALTLGVAEHYGRVYTLSQDLYPIAAFCNSIMHHAHRMEARYMDQRKSDFLGSISHEMRSPLHGLLANIELALEMSGNQEQRDMLHAATVSGTQLLTSMDKVLDYAHISAESPSSDDSKDQKKNVELPQSARTVSQHRLKTAQSSENSETSVPPAFEVVVLRTLASMREGLDARPSEEVHQSAQHSLESRASASHGSDGRASTLHETSSHTLAGQAQRADKDVFVILDTDDRNFRHVTDLGALITVVEELLKNALNHTSSGCIRISLLPHEETGTSSHNLLLRIEDSGKGIQERFLKHRLFVPFSQEDEIESGTGLGLPLVKRNVDSLGGNIEVHSTVGAGTTVSVFFDVECLLLTESNAVMSLKHTSEKVACLLAPPPHASTQAHKAHAMLRDSLSRTLPRRCNIRLLPPGSPDAADLAIFTSNDLASFAEDDVLRQNCPRLILRSSATASDEQGVHRTGHAEVTIVGPILPRQLVSAVSKLFTVSEEPNESTLDVASSRGKRSDVATEPTRRASHHDAGGEKGGSGDLDAQKPKEPISAAERDSAPLVSEGPSLLLVDDNNINLKVLANYVKKCGITNPKTVTGGQEAIDAFREALQAGGGGKGFDIVFMDLSMPTVTGFDATVAIRALEREASRAPEEAGRHHVASIIALTGLVSAKDRKAALAAGVDDYITKPAKLQSIKGVVQAWRQSQSPPDAEETQGDSEYSTL